MTTNTNHFGIKKLILNGTFWTFVGYGASQVLKLASSLILARMLSPEDYGLIAIVTVIYIGVTMVSDLGLGPNIMQNPRGDDEDFLNTAWTVQVIKGLLTWLVCIALSWPVSQFYGQDILFPIIIISTFSAVFTGFNSTGIYSTDKHLDLRKQTIFGLTAQLSSLIVMVIIAYFHPTVWALVTGGLVSAGVNMYLSHRLVPMTNRFNWEPETVKSIISFGKWVIVSSTLGFIVMHSSSLILGKFLTMTNLGLFSIGVTLSKVVEGIYFAILQKVITPVFAKIRHLENAEVRAKLTKVKAAVMGLFLPILWFLVIFAHDIVGLLFDPRYAGAAWILQVYSLTYIPTVISGLGAFYLILGDNKLLARITFIKTIIFFSLVVLGWYFNKGNGIIVGIALYNSTSYIIELYAHIKYKVWLKGIDLLGFIISAIVIWTGLTLTGGMDRFITQLTS